MFALETRHRSPEIRFHITSLSYITVLWFSVTWLGEQIDPLKIAGILLILAGVWFISRGPHHTTSSNEAA